MQRRGDVNFLLLSAKRLKLFIIFSKSEGKGVLRKEANFKEKKKKEKKEEEEEEINMAPVNCIQSVPSQWRAEETIKIKFIFRRLNLCRH